MADKYTDAPGSNTSPYDTWAKAADTIEIGTEACAANERNFVKNTHTDTITADLTIQTTATGVQIISCSDAGEPPTTPAAGATIDGTATSGVDININGGWWWGFTFKPSNTSTGGVARFGNVDGKPTALEDCTINLGTISTNAAQVGVNSASNTWIDTRRCSWVWGHASQKLNIAGAWRDVGSDFGAGSATPSTLFTFLQPAHVEIYGADLSDFTSLVAVGTVPYSLKLFGCKIHASFAPPSWTEDGSGEIWMFDCDDGDEHYHLRHYNYRGNTTISTTVKMNTADAAKYDGTNAYSLVVAGVNGTFGEPYQSPWISVYHSGTSAITPLFQTVRTDSVSEFTDGEVWSEWLAKVTASSTRYTFYSDRRGILAAAANQAGGLSLAQWDGEGGTAETQQLDTGAAITPAEIGPVIGRVCVVGAKTVYVNAKILGLGQTESNVERVGLGGIFNTNVTTGGGGGGFLPLGMTGGMRA
jgi:hypothetical protein